MSSSHLIEYLGEFFTNKPALLQKPLRANTSVAAKEEKKTTAGLANDTPGTCPFCKQQMEIATTLISDERDELSVFLCRSDQYIAPIPNDYAPAALIDVASVAPPKQEKQSSVDLLSRLTF